MADRPAASVSEKYRGSWSSIIPTSIADQRGQFHFPPANSKPVRLAAKDGQTVEAEVMVDVAVK